MLFEEREKHLWRGLHHVYVQERKKVTSRTSGIGERAGEISWGREELVRLLTLSARHSPLFVTSLHIATIKMK